MQIKEIELLNVPIDTNITTITYFLDQICLKQFIQSVKRVKQVVDNKIVYLLFIDKSNSNFVVMTINQSNTILKVGNFKLRAQLYKQQQYIEIPQEFAKTTDIQIKFQEIKHVQKSPIDEIVIEMHDDLKQEEEDETDIQSEYSQEEFNEKHLYVALRVDSQFSKVQQILEQLKIDLVAFSKQESSTILSLNMIDKKPFLRKLEQMQIKFEIFTTPATPIMISNFDPSLMYPTVIFQNFGKFGFISRISFYIQSKKAKIWFLNQKSAENALEMNGEKIGDYKIWIERPFQGQRELLIQSVARNCTADTIKALMIQIDMENPFENDKRISIIPDRRQKNNSGGAQALFTCKTADIAKQIIQRLKDAQIQVDGVVGTISAQIKK